MRWSIKQRSRLGFYITHPRHNSIPHLSPCRMCYALILYDQYSCTHQIMTKRQKMDCRKEYCGISENHTFAPHNCSETCARRMEPERSMVSNTVPRPCDKCRYGL
ncbi:hypothetical protein BDQ12DRAFT_56237 [Crucibulum laeve]|uniref:Uncharacterized protein n=1 Tax=Crucibulum laeve TaxID=68775 RepID=A0A5C3M6F4_9AGAR|nr:hypothetical protein BDQ12DRAFT_56237 [Crucibulum laeve]